MRAVRAKPLWKREQIPKTKRFCSDYLLGENGSVSDRSLVAFSQGK